MEVVLYGIFTSLWWISSITVFLPFLLLLKYNKYFRNRWFSFIYVNFFMNYLDPVLIPLRRKAFELLKDNLSQRDASKPLKLLEIGIGSGENFQFYPENSHLTALDMNVSFDAYFQANKKKYPNIKCEKSIISVAEDMKEINDSSMDVVVSTYVLCSVTSVNDVLKEIKRVLKPGGKFFFMEHVSHPRSTVGFIIQKFGNPLWCRYFNGCCLLRNPEENIRKTGYSDVICVKKFPQSMILFVRPHIYGIATK